MLAGQQYDGFKPELWSAELNYSLKNSMVGGSLVNRSYEGEIQAMGDTVHILEPGAVTANAYTAYSDITFEQPSETDRTLIITEAFYTAVDVDDIDEAQANVNLMQAHMGEASYALADKQDQFIFASAAAANSGVASDQANPVSLTRANIYARCVDAAFVLDKQNVRKNGRWAAVSPSEYALLLQAPEFVPNGDTAATPLYAGGGTSDSARVVATGQVGSVAGFTVFETNNLTTNSGVRKVMFGTTQAITFASQIAKVEAVRREARFADAVKALDVYGKKEIRPEALATLNVS
tara:strand:+ start:393 stop:1271 length:879 start_codon:yes stop_codon:yes gene_type:complete